MRTPFQRRTTGEEVVEPVSQALSLSHQQNAGAPMAWHQLGVIAHANLKRWPAAIRAQQSLLGFYPEQAGEWRRLVSLQLQLDDHKGAADSMRIAYERGLLDREDDTLQLSRLLFHSGVPYQAAVILDRGIEKGTVAPE